MPGAYEVQMRLLTLLELELQVAARLHVDAGNEPMSSARAAVVLTRSHLSRPTALSSPIVLPSP